MLNYYIESFGDRYIVLFKMYPELMILLLISFVAIFILFMKNSKGGLTSNQKLTLIVSILILSTIFTAIYLSNKYRNHQKIDYSNSSYTLSSYNRSSGYMPASVGVAHTYDEDHQKRRNRQRS